MRLPTFQSVGTHALPAELTKPTDLLDFKSPQIQQLILERGWQALPEFERIGAIYDFVRNEIKFGYNESDNLPASSVLIDGIGQCNTKGTLLMALLRANGIPCRLHGFTINKSLQKGAITGWAYVLAPKSIIHSWVEILFEGRWVNLEGFILDESYLIALQQKYPTAQEFCGFGAAVADLRDPPVRWKGTDTYIQKEGINADFGIFNSPDDFYRKHGTNLFGLKRWVFEIVVRAQMNRNVERIRFSEVDR
jgi:transglutaminase-like putative cysteine protease